MTLSPLDLLAATLLAECSQGSDPKATGGGDDSADPPAQVPDGSSPEWSIDELVEVVENSLSRGLPNVIDLRNEYRGLMIHRDDDRPILERPSTDPGEYISSGEPITAAMARS